MVLNHPVMKYIMLVGILLVILTACSEFTIEKPEGFAEIEIAFFEKGDVLYKAVSPEGVLFKVKTAKNYPRMELEFWAKALSAQLQKEGYTLIGEEQRFKAGKKEGAYLKWALPFGNASYIYITSILVCDDKILITEAAGEHTLFKKYEDSIILSMQSISYN